ncbi:MAG TPA: conjugal transfer protein [Streptosporangiaceae bacterium]|nr:conjugal transfer protein [Streptosporangiaceae bacterium]
MVRRAILDRDETLDADDHALPVSQPSDDFEPVPDKPWRGAGGRWLVWAGRALVWAVLLLLGYRGVLAIVTNQPARGVSGRSAAAAPAAASGQRFPVSLAEAYALQFGTAYMNFSPASSAARGQELSRFLPPGSDSELGWNGAGTQRLESEQVAGISVTGAHTAVVTLLASLSGGRLIELGVPIYASGRGMSVSGAPALLPAPAQAAPPASTAGSDQATQYALESQLPAFFQAYASGDPATLARFEAPGAHITSLNGAVSFDGIDAVVAPPGGTTRSVTVTVTWQFPTTAGGAGTPGSLEMAYQLTVVRQGGSWDVQSIGPLAAPESPGPP